MESYQGDASYQGSTPGNNYQFQEQSQKIASNIKKISQNVSAMSKMVNQVQTPQDSTEMRVQLRQIQHYTQKLAKDTSSMIMSLMKMPISQPVQKLCRERLSDEYISTLNSFQATQKLAAQKTKEEVKVISSQPINIKEPFGVHKKRHDLVEMEASDLHQQQKMTTQAECSLHELQQREEDYRQLENDIMDVNKIFTDLGTLIHAQAPTVDSIESHVEYTSQAVESGTAQLRDAYNSKNKLRKKKVYIAIVVTIVISVIIIIIVKT